MGSFGFVFTSLEHDSNYLDATLSRKGKSIQLHTKLTMVNYIIIVLIRLLFFAFVPMCYPDYPFGFDLIFFFLFVPMTPSEEAWAAIFCTVIAVLLLATWYYLFFYDPDRNKFPLLQKYRLPKAPLAKFVRTKVLFIENLNNYRFEESEEETNIEMTHL